MGEFALAVIPTCGKRTRGHELVAASLAGVKGRLAVDIPGERFAEVLAKKSFTMVEYAVIATICRSTRRRWKPGTGLKWCGRRWVDGGRGAET